MTHGVPAVRTAASRAAASRAAAARTLPVRAAAVRTAVALLLLLLGLAHGQAECDLSLQPTRLSVEGFGTAYFQEFDTDVVRDRVELSGGVCITSEDTSWTIRAESATLIGLQGGGAVEVEIIGAILFYQGWRIASEVLNSDGTVLAMKEVVFGGHGVMGNAALLELDLPIGRPRGSQVRVQGRSFVLEADAAELIGEGVDLRNVLITTCTCPGKPFYVVTGSEAHLELAAQKLIVGNGHLSVGGLRLPLAPDFELSGALFDELSPPVTLEYRPGASGTGLGVVVPDFELSEGLSLEAGLLGLDGANPVQAFGLARYRSERVNFTIGRARGGPRADLVVVEPLAPGLAGSFAINNRHEARSDFLHEGVLALSSEPAALELGPESSLHLNGNIFAAASSQVNAGVNIVSPRLGANADVRLALPTGPGATASIGVNGSLTDYPAYGVSQYGVGLRSSWSYRRDPWTVELKHDRLWTDSGSPFTVKLDRLLPLNRLEVRASASAGLAGDLRGSAGLDLDYDLLLAGGSIPGGLDRFGIRGALSYPLNGWTFGLNASLELAGRLDPDPAGQRRAHFETRLNAEQGEWELGARLRYNLLTGQQGLALLEASAAVPLEYKSGTLTPFLALDFAPTILRRESPRLSGHGVALTWRSCCGTIKVGYRQQESSFATTFAFALEH